MKPHHNDEGNQIDLVKLNLRATLNKTARPRLRESIQRRLDELVILEITQEGGRQYLHFSVRELYNHVLKAIKRLPGASQSYWENGMFLSQTLAHERKPRFSDDRSAVKKGLPNAPIEVFDQSDADLHSVQDDMAKQVKGGKENPLKHRERLGAHLHPRDMRRLVTPFSLANEPELIVRRHVMLLNFDPLRAIILRDRLLVLVPDGADSLLETIERRIRGGAAEIENEFLGESPDSHQGDSPDTADKEKEPFLMNRKETDLSGTDSTPPPTLDNSVRAEEYAELSNIHLDRDEFDELKNRSWINLPFELQCVDAVLHGVTDMLFLQALDIQKDAMSSMEYLLRPNTGVGTFAQEMLRTTKSDVHAMVSRVNSFVRALTLVLNEDEDMALMNLARLISHPERFVQPAPAHVLEEESDEPELILEAHLQQAVTLTNELESLAIQLQTIEGLMNMKSDTLQNRILYVNMLTTTITMAVTMGVVVSAFFGMNVPVYMYDGEPGKYYKPMLIGSVGGCVVLSILMLFLLRRVGIFTSSV